MRKTRPIADRFWEKVSKTDSCWVWTGVKTRGGYGYLHKSSGTEQQSRRAHRISWELHNGQIPDGLWVLHKCDNPPCVNPDHLFLGDRKANMDDCAAKGRICNIGKSRMTHCQRGHEFNVENTYMTNQGHRGCRICRLDSQRRRRAAAAIRSMK